MEKINKNMESLEIKFMIYELEIDLIGLSPRIWRKVLVPNHMNFYDLHLILQKVMGWTNSHLHFFDFGNFEILDTKDEDAQIMIDSLESKNNPKKYLEQKKETLYSIFNNKKDVFHYVYDYGDNWLHKITITNILMPNDLYTYPICVGGEKACPPEDCMGVNGYEDFLSSIKNKKNEGYESSLKWIGGYFNPDSFCPNMVNRSLHWDKKIFLKANKFDSELMKHGHKLL